MPSSLQWVGIMNSLKAQVERISRGLCLRWLTALPSGPSLLYAVHKSIGMLESKFLKVIKKQLSKQGRSRCYAVSDSLLQCYSTWSSKRAPSINLARLTSPASFPSLSFPIVLSHMEFQALFLLPLKETLLAFPFNHSINSSLSCKIPFQAHLHWFKRPTCKYSHAQFLKGLIII